MSGRALARLLGAYALALVVACVAVRACVGVRVDPDRRGETVASVWHEGEIVARALVAAPGDRDAALDAALASHRGATLVYERVVADGPILARPEIAFAMSLVPGVDGVKATRAGKTAYVTPDELLARQGYDRGHTLSDLSLAIGADVPLVLALLAERLQTTVPEIKASATLRRVRMVRTVPSAAPAPVGPTAETLSRDDVRDAALDAARFLARGVRADGRFRYFIDAPSNRSLSGYDWPRHAGATYFLAQASTMRDDPLVSSAVLRASALLAGEALVGCGDFKCIGSDNVVEIGSSALAVIALAEVSRRGVAAYTPTVAELARFLLSLQRPDGEFMHQYDRQGHMAVDVQFLYFSGEATLALARAAALTGNEAMLQGASKGLAHLVGPAWHFFGDRYYFGEEHWTCQALGDLWDRAPDPKALDFCVRWNRMNQKMQFSAGDAPFDLDGSYGVTPLVTPRLTPVGSRCEAAVATLDAAKKANLPKAELDALDRQLRRSLALLIRQQLRPAIAGPIGPMSPTKWNAQTSHLFVDPGAIHGALPGSHVDWQLRIDYAQHAGSAMIRWLEVTR